MCAKVHVLTYLFVAKYCLLIEQCIVVLELATNKFPHVPYLVHITGLDKLLKSVNCFLVHEYSYYEGSYVSLISDRGRFRCYKRQSIPHPCDTFFCLVCL